MSEKRQAEQSKSRLNFLQPDLENLIQIIAEIVAEVTTILDFDDLIEEVVRLTQKSLKYDQVILHIFDSSRQLLTLRVLADANNDQIVRSDSIQGEVSLPQIAAQNNHTIWIRDLKTETPEYFPTEPTDIRSELHIPLMRDEKVIGILSLRSTKPCVFDEYSVIALKTLAAQIAIPIEQAHQQKYQSSQNVYDDGSRLPVSSRYPQASEIRNKLHGIQTLAGIQEVFDRIVTEVVDELGYMGAFLAVLDEKKQILPVQAVAVSARIRRLKLLDYFERRLGVRVVGSSASLINDPGNVGVQSCLNGEIIISHDFYDFLQPEVTQEQSRWIQRLSGFKTGISIPLLVGDRVVGNLFAGTRKAEISEDDLGSLQLFVANAAIAVQNAIVFEEVNRKLAQREAELNQLRGIERMIISSSLDLNDVLKRILNGTLELTNAKYGHVVLADKYATDFTDRISYPELSVSVGESRPAITQWVIRDKQPKLIKNIDQTEVPDEIIKIVTEEVQFKKHSNMKSHLGVPILSGDELIGVIHIESLEPGAFDNQSREMLEQIAVQAAIAITNAHQFKEQKELQKRLANADQVVAMGDMASNMVHSINNWVGSIRVDAKYLLHKYTQGQFDQDESVEMLTDMLKNAETTLDLAENIRRPFQALASEEIDIEECLANVLRNLKVKDLSGLQVITDFEKDLPRVIATQQLQLVFENLISNALRAMQNRGDLKLTARCPANKQWVEVTISDSGPGLRHDVKESAIFKLGATGREEGLGFGLWWCDTFLKRWRGDIQLLENTPAGCKFFVRLPSVGSLYLANNVGANE
jgi:GAF domain-containing protein